MYYVLSLKKKKKKNYAPFCEWGSTDSRLEPQPGGSLLFTTKIPEIPGTHFIDLGRMKDCIDLGATRVKKVKKGGCSRICVLNPRLIYLNNILILKYLEFLKINRTLFP